ncbi:Octicosapeptide/Phox/Bem1p domain-containing protein/tetratricopeptide repeat-containing protein [Gossypium australe]|uniref:Octicosapeptide/Phox/Bem1p domain-containing protein/tetratricopeptide repeat-containing protein n=1 Tax=Gossypium australe TaxID=47621 RepID=A0A5B6WZE7_9ROSI|nr:Octicosapeptide/Phox/Bem1p domain-containing protein/tetratricopeptide repeat-containing protein [Gossypium australe]
MGKHSVKNKKQTGKAVHSNVTNPKRNDSDLAVFVSISRELKEEGNKLFQRRDHEGALVKYEKALELLPKNHMDVCHLRSNMAACYMQMGSSEYPRAIRECNLALEVTPDYSKALLKRARCYEALNRLELAFRDVNTVLNMEPNNVMALEISERVQSTLEKRGLQVNDTVIELPPEYVEYPSASKVVKEKTKKKNKKIDKARVDQIQEKTVDENMNEKKAEDKRVVEEIISSKMEEESKKNVKLIFGEDIRCTRLPLNCSLVQLREIIHDRFPSSRAVLVKYRDEEGDLVTITSDEELRLAEISAVSRDSMRLYVVEVNSDQDPFFERFKREEVHNLENGDAGKVTEARQDSCCIDDWIIEFARLFKRHVGFDSDAYLNLHELGMKPYSEAMEDTVTSEEAQDHFGSAAEKFQEMTALALFNWGNVHMSRVRKRVYFTNNGSRESVLKQIKTNYDWAQFEYTKAGKSYEEALRIKPDFYEAILALGQQQFEQAKLSWYYAISNNANLETWPSKKVLQLYNNAEKNMEKGMLMWEELEVQRLRELSKPNEEQNQIMGLDGLFKDISADEVAEQALTMSAQINLLWGAILYERSIMEFKLGLPLWQECLEVAVEKFEHAGASPMDIAVMVKNHCSNNNAPEGLGFTIDEIIQAWNEKYEAKKWQSRIPSFRLKPLLKRRVSKNYHA